MKQVFVILVFLLFTSFNALYAAEDFSWLTVGGKVYGPPASMEEMISNVREMNSRAAPRQEIARWMTYTLDLHITNMNSPELIFDRRNLIFWKSPIPGSKLFDDWRQRSIMENETIAKWAWDNQMGNCQEHANLVYYILEKAGVKEPFRILGNEKHAFTVWGLKEGADLNDPDTWGPDALVIDSWLGKTLDSDEVNDHKYFKNGDEKVFIADRTPAFVEDAPRWDYLGENRTFRSSSDEDCFVATAAFGTPLANEIQVLRDFRDQRLRQSTLGRVFIKWYEKNGPGMAEALNNHPEYKAFVRAFFLKPLVYIIKNTRS